MRQELSIAHEITTKWFRHPGYIINAGQCFLWAALFRRVVTSTVTLCDAVDRIGMGHAFTKIDDLYYDAETPQGVSNWIELPFFVRDGGDRAAYIFHTYADEAVFLSTWNRGYDDTQYVDKIVGELAL